MLECAFPRSFPLEALHMIPQQLRGKLNDAQLARLAGWNLIGYGLSIGAQMDLTSISTTNAPDDDESIAALFDRAIATVELPEAAAERAFPWEQLGPLVWFLVNKRWRT